MKRKRNFFGSASIVVLALMAFFLWGQVDDPTGKGIPLVQETEAAGLS